MTVTIQIGNSDDKLTQAEWAAFVNTVRSTALRFSDEIHFFGASSNYERWQNAAVIIECKETNREALRFQLKEIKAHWRQDSIAWTEGVTEFI